ncbi:glycosyltransferase, partial [Oleiphilus sp. HI0132]|uniref:glycosyltransferase n=1 Tax=Oleiphilus sp. HI0132 TaxID=1822270 RepID=UPI0009ECCABF
KLINCKYLVIRESTIISQRFTGYKRLIFDLLYNCYGSQDLLICQTNLMKDSLIAARHKNVISNIVTIPNPVSIQRVGLMLDKSELVSNSEQCFEIIMVGRLVAIKNHELVISALARIKKQQPYNFKLRVLGDGPTKNELKTLVEANGLNENVEFLGNMDNPFQYMNKANLGVVASISEGFPNVLLEMMAAGTNNIITTPCTGDLDQLPNISITNDHSVHSMTNAISSALITKQDYSMKYRNYVQERDVSNYWAIIDKYLKA